MAVVEQAPQELGVMAHEGAFVGGAREMVRGAAAELWNGVKSLGSLAADAAVKVAMYEAAPVEIPAQRMAMLDERQAALDEHLAK